MKISMNLMIIVSALTLGGCVVAIGGDEDGYSTSYTSHSGPGFGSVYAADVNANSVSFTVRDNGCTDATFFDVDVRKTDTKAFDVGVRRTREDYCETYNESGTTISWTFRELGIPDGAEISILNGVRR